ncbi:unnamed protein product [Chrysoparadoxa australica]
MGDAKSKALKDAEKCVKLAKDWPKAYSRLGAAQHALKRYEAAVESYREGMRLDPDNAGLQAGRKVAEEALEALRAARWKQGQREREAEEARREAQAKAKAHAAADSKAAEAVINAKQKEGKEADPLASFLSEVASTETSTQGVLTSEKTMNDKYTNQDLGSSEKQVERLLGNNYKWKNLNPLEPLMLDTDCTTEDIKLRYRKLSALVHPDKCLGNPKARDAFEEVKKAYQQLMDDNRRKIVLATVEAIRGRVRKDRAKLKKEKNWTDEQLTKQKGSLEAHQKMEAMKEFASVEMRRREIEKHKQAQKKRERDQEDEEQSKLIKMRETEKEWNEEGGREVRVGDWRKFQTHGKKKVKKNKSWKEEVSQGRAGRQAASHMPCLLSPALLVIPTALFSS